MPTAFKFFFTCAFELVALAMPPLPWAIVLGCLAVGSFIWGVTDLLRDIRVMRSNAMPNSVASAAFDRHAKMIAFIIATALLIFATATGYGLNYFHHKYADVRRELGFVFQLMPNFPNFGIKVDGKRLVHHYGEEFKRAMMVCRAQDNRVDALDDTKIEKSATFDIKADEMTMELTLSPQLLQRAAALTTVVECQLALLKDHMSGERISSQRQIQDSGGMLVSRFGSNLEK